MELVKIKKILEQKVVILGKKGGFE